MFKLTRRMANGTVDVSRNSKRKKLEPIRYMHKVTTNVPVKPIDTSDSATISGNDTLNISKEIKQEEQEFTCSSEVIGRTSLNIECSANTSRESEDGSTSEIVVGANESLGVTGIKQEKESNFSYVSEVIYTNEDVEGGLIKTEIKTEPRNDVSFREASINSELTTNDAGSSGLSSLPAKESQWTELQRKDFLKKYKIFTGSRLNHFQCNYCFYTASLYKTLARHMKTQHSSEKPYSCHLCNYKAKLQRNVEQHIAINHITKKFSCTLCLFSATTSAMFKRHMNMHARQANKSFSCDQCAFKTIRKRLLKAHMKIHTRK